MRKRSRLGSGRPGRLSCDGGHAVRTAVARGRGAIDARHGCTPARLYPVLRVEGLDKQEGLNVNKLMQRTSSMLAAAAMLALAGPAAHAQVQFAYTAHPAEMRAGPAYGYPLVTLLPGGTQLSVQGCLIDYSWCDVVWGTSRGWVAAEAMSYYNQNRYEPLSVLAPVIGLAILGFALDDYWGHHYQDRRWYPQRERWAHPVPPPQPPRALGAGPAAPAPRMAPGARAFGRPGGQMAPGAQQHRAPAPQRGPGPAGRQPHRP